MGTYKVRGKWEKGTWTKPDTGLKYKRRKHVSVYTTGEPLPRSTHYLYKGMIREQEPIRDTSQDRIDPFDDQDFLGTPPPEVIYDQGIEREMGYTPETSLQEALYQAYSNYANQIDKFNDSIERELGYYFTLHQSKYGYSDQVREANVEHHAVLRYRTKFPYAKWYEKSLNKTLGELPFDPPTLHDEMESLYAVNNEGLKFLAHEPTSIEKFLTGMAYGWKLIDATGLPRIAAMGLAGMPPVLVGSMAASTVGYGLVERYFNPQNDYLVGQFSSLRDVVTKAGRADTQNWKQQYEQLNRQAMEKGIIKGAWTLRLSRNMPIKEKWKRLYVTLLAHLDKSKPR